MTKLHDTLQLSSKKIVVLGVGITGLSCVRYFQSHNIACAVNDSRKTPIDAAQFSQDFPNTSLVLGHWDQALIAQAELLIVSPGIDLATPEIAQAISPSCEVFGDIELFCRLSDTPVVAVTGSNGKSTVVSLLAYLGKALGYKVELGGNIGIPVLDRVDESLDLLVLELSSFQCETLSSMQSIASCMLNVSDDHLDRHKTLENYTNIKQKIYHNAQHLIFNRDDVATTPQAPYVLDETTQISFGCDKPKTNQFGLAEVNQTLMLMHGYTPLLAVKELPLSGIHNGLNCLAALAIGYSAGWSINDMLAHIGRFKGLPHRCEKVSSINGVTWINDSKATNVGATLAAINGLKPTLTASQKLILIAGGEGKGADFTPLTEALNQQVAHLITFGKDGHAIASIKADAYQVNDLNSAVKKANKLAAEGDIVLLSPACASLDMFDNYMARGEAFVDAIALLDFSDVAEKEAL